ncbi:MAG: tocopherol cyclase family protein [Cyanobacteriota bacterium]|nr:tocopherol cyclase family protein [Cyanobacteriota bacterium]
MTAAPALQVPHAGYHGSWVWNRFFEGWYYRLTIPDLAESFAFMYSIERDPWAKGGGMSGGSAQLLGPQDHHQWRTFPRIEGFWADPEQLALGHWGKTQGLGSVLPPQYLDPTDFWRYVREGYQATATLNQGILRDPASRQVTRWCYQIRPIHTYGIPPQATMGWLSYLPIFEPGWQILMAEGGAEGWLEWQGSTYRFGGELAPAAAYVEKNWGGSFPSQWFWMQCHQADSALSLTSAGGKRGVLGIPQTVGMVSLHWRGRFFAWLPENSQIAWRVDPWGAWQVVAQQSDYKIMLRGTASRPGTPLLAPTSRGLRLVCRETLHGHLHLQLWQRVGQVWTPILETHSEWAGLETGGDPWSTPWQVGDPQLLS